MIVRLTFRAEAAQPMLLLIPLMLLQMHLKALFEKNRSSNLMVHRHILSAVLAVLSAIPADASIGIDCIPGIDSSSCPAGLSQAEGDACLMACGTCSTPILRLGVNPSHAKQGAFCG
jgi:hypothetical protein